MEEISEIISEVTGIAANALLVFSLENENSTEIEDYIFENEEGKYISGYYINMLSNRQYIFLVHEKGYYSDSLVKL